MSQLKAFTLIELILVVILIASMVGVILPSWEKTKGTTTPQTKNIKEYLASHGNDKTLRELICYNRCQECAVLQNTTLLAHSINTFFSPNAIIYRHDTLGGVTAKKFQERIIDKKFVNVCLEATLYPNGSFSPFILYDNDTYTVYPSLSNETPSFKEERLAFEALQRLDLFPSSDSYYRP